MKLHIPEPTINIGKDGFEGHCKLGRKDMGEKLSTLLSALEDPIVVALDAPWGSGKSHLLKCWCGAHIHEFSHLKDIVVYFDAFKHDYLDDPLLALTSLLDDRFASEKGAEKIIKKLKNAAFSAGKPLIRIGLAAATAGVSEFAGPIVTAALDATNNQANELVDKMWEAETGRISAMENFAAALTELTAAENESEQRKVIFIVDELDRCRPDYALSLLEIVKHFFAVPGVHFVLGVNLKELSNSIQTRYGAGVDTNAYLQKFIDVRMGLETSLQLGNQGSEAKIYFGHVAGRMGLDNPHYKASIDTYLELWGDKCPLTLRNVTKLVSAAVLTPTLSQHLQNRARYILIAGLLILKTGNPELLDKLRSPNRLVEAYQEISDYFAFPADVKNSYASVTEIVNVWHCFLKGAPILSEQKPGDLQGILGIIGSCDDLRKELFSKYLDVFDAGNFVREKS